MAKVCGLLLLAVAVVAVAARSVDILENGEYVVKNHDCGHNPPYQIHEVTGYKTLRRYKDATLYQAEAPYYKDPVLVLVAPGSHYDIGFAYGTLLANEIQANHDALTQFMFPTVKAQRLAHVFMDWQYSFWLGHYLPAEYQEEMRGLADGMVHAGKKNGELLMQRMLVLSSFPGDIFVNVFYLVIDEIIHSGEADVDNLSVDSLSQMNGRFFELLAELKDNSRARNNEQCSMFSAWGSRTLDGSVIAGRNLDWATETGISKNKLVFVAMPTGKVPNASVGFAGMLGALLGMGKGGITVAEAGEDVNKVTFRGTQWTLRLRHIMENCRDMTCALAYWKDSSANTEGMNHMITSSRDATVSTKHPAVLVETMARYTAYFFDNDPREDLVDDAGHHLGFPLKDAIVRTNHAYDATIREHEIHNVKWGAGTLGRYMALNRGIAKFESDGVKITGEEGVYLAYAGAGSTSNVISGVFHARESEMWIAWEQGFGKDFVPAHCGAYLHFDMADLWG